MTRLLYAVPVLALVLVVLLIRLLHSPITALLDLEEPWKTRWPDGTPRPKVRLPKRTVREEWRRL